MTKTSTEIIHDLLGHTVKMPHDPREGMPRIGTETALPGVLPSGAGVHEGEASKVAPGASEGQKSKNVCRDCGHKTFTKAWWAAHPEKREKHKTSIRATYKERAKRKRFHRVFPRAADLASQIDWFKREFLVEAQIAKTPKERGDWLKMAFVATLKGQSAMPDADMQDYKEHLKRLLDQERQRSGIET